MVGRLLHNLMNDWFFVLQLCHHFILIPGKGEEKLCFEIIVAILNLDDVKFTKKYYLISHVQNQSPDMYQNITSNCRFQKHCLFVNFRSIVTCTVKTQHLKRPKKEVLYIL